MVVSLTLLDGVRWEGTPVAGDRPRALLALASEQGRPVRSRRLVEMICARNRWPARPRACRVLVSRTSAVCGAGAVAHERAREALELGAALPPVPLDDRGPLADIRRAAGQDLAAARLLLARAAHRTGRHAEALPLLETAHAQRPDDEGLLADVLRSEAAVRGPAPALHRFEDYRRDISSG